MTTPAAPSVTRYSLTGSAVGPFATQWRYEASAEVVVTIADADDTETLLTAGSDYTLTASEPLNTGGAVTLQVGTVPGGGWPAGARLVLRRRTARTQPLALPDVGGHKPFATERALDRIVRMIQELSDAVAEGGGGSGGGGIGIDGTDGWSPVPAYVEDGERRVIQIADWIGGGGDKPVTGRYIGASGLVADIAAAGDFRGAPGGASGGGLPSIGAFPSSPPTIAAGVNRVTTVGYSAGAVIKRLSGAAAYVHDTDVDAAYVTAHPRAAFLSADGRGWRQDEAQPTPEMFGAVMNGTADDFAALNAWLQWCAFSGREGFLTGTARCNSTITVTNRSLALRGGSPQISNIVFGSGARLVYQGGTPSRQASPTLRLSRLGLRSAVLNNGVGLDVSYTGGEGSTSATLLLDDVGISGVDAFTCWTTGARLNNARNVTLNDCMFEGAVGASYPWSTTIGLDIDGANSPVEIKARNTNFYGWERGVRLRGTLEGVYFHQITMVAVDIGIDDDVSGGGSAGEPLFFLTDSHINFYSAGYRGKSRFQSRISGNLFYAQFGASAVGISIVNDASAYANFLIQDNIFFRIPPDGTQSSTAIEVGGGGSGEIVRIDGNLFDGAVPWTRAIHLLASSNGVRVGQNVYVNATTTVLDQGTGNTVEGSGANEILTGNGSPEGVVSGGPGQLYRQLDGANGYTLWVKRTAGTGTTGWATNGGSHFTAVIQPLAGILLPLGQGVSTTYSGLGRNLISHQTADNGVIIGDVNVRSPYIAISANLIPDTASTLSLGTSSFRLQNIFLLNAPNVSSDERLKRMGAALPPALLAALNALPIRRFQYLVSIQEKGEVGARQHVGVSAQELAATFEAAGEDPRRWSLFCEDVLMEQVAREVTVIDEDGVPQTRIEHVHVPALEPDGSPRTVLSLRYEELAMLLAAADRARMDALEDRIRQLEGAAA
jgi:hypothetical protein